MSVADRYDAVQAHLAERLPERVTAHPTLSAVVALTVVSLALRLFALGARTPHYDEARVAFWALYLADHAWYSYMPISHGPFIHVVGSWVFGLLGASDITMRLPIALFGGLLPLAALFFRRYLSKAAVVGLAGVFALDPTLLYFSRFFRNDVLTAAFAVVAFGCFVVALFRRRHRYLYAGAVFLGLSFSTKENAVLYVLCWLGAGTLVLGHDLFRPLGEESIRTRVGHRWRQLKGVATGESGNRWGPVKRAGIHLFGAALLFVAVLVFFYAPRGSAGSTVGFWEAVANPTQFPALVQETLFEVYPQGFEKWTERSSKGEGLFANFEGPLQEMGKTLAYGSGVTVALGVAGFLYALYDWLLEDRLHPLALAGFYWAAASFVGYPLVASVGKPSWLVVHVVVALALPAALAVAVLVRWGQDAIAADDAVNLVLVGLLLGVAVGGSLYVGYDTTYQRSQAQDNVMVQYAQPGSDMSQFVTDLRRVAAANDRGPDVVVLATNDVEYWDFIVAYDGIVPGSYLPVCTAAPVEKDTQRQMTLRSLPLPWYFAAEDAMVHCSEDVSAVDQLVAESPPPMVVTHAEDGGADDLEDELDGQYDRQTYEMFVYENTVEVFVRNDLAE
ncbi:flippase activity-associated protein Agl23 [Halobacteriales archaeon Cl-PHB]